MLLFVEQVLNGLQLGVMLFLMSAGLTLVFGIMGVINLAHGTLYMAGAYITATVMLQADSFALALLVTLPAVAALGLVIELLVIRHLYERDHLDQVLATFGLILFLNELTVILWGRQPILLSIPEFLSGHVELVPGVPYPVYRLAIIAVGILVAALLYVLLQHTRLGMVVRAGATNREMIGALGVNISRLFTLVFAFGALLAGLAGFMAGPLVAVEVGMGEDILILTFVVIVIGGIGSVRGALVGALLVGLVDTLGRAFLPSLFALFMSPAEASGVGAALASMSVYVLMAIVLITRPRGLFPAHA